MIHFFICPDISRTFSVFVSWVEVPTEMPTSPMSDMGPDDTVRTPREIYMAFMASRLRGNCILVIQTNRANALGWRELRLRKFTIWCLHDWSCWFEPPRYLLLSPRCSAVGLLSCASVRLAQVVLKLIALIVEEKWCLQKLSAAEMFPFYRHIQYYICTEILRTW